MSREELLKTIRLCKTDGNAECEECSLHGAKGDCVATLLQECEEEIVFLDGLLAAERMLEDALRKQVALRNERLDKMCAEIDHLREATKMMPKWVSVSERLPESDGLVLVTFTGKIQNKEYIVGGLIMKILKPGKVDTRKLTCPMCGCEFVCGEYEYTFWDNDSLLVDCPCCHDSIPFYCGEPYEEPAQDDREYLAHLMSKCPMGTEAAADYLLSYGVTFREATT